MTAVIPLGTFTQVPLREAWPKESGNFTPWLAKTENLKRLAEALDIGELQDQQTEVPVGKFLIDILAIDGDGNTVIIENQLEQMACTRFRRHRVRCFDGTGGVSWSDGSLPASSSLRLCG